MLLPARLLVEASAPHSIESLHFEKALPQRHDTLDERNNVRSTTANTAAVVATSSDFPTNALPTLVFTGREYGGWPSESSLSSGEAEPYLDNAEESVTKTSDYGQNEHQPRSLCLDCTTSEERTPRNHLLPASFAPSSGQRNGAMSSISTPSVDSWLSYSSEKGRSIATGCWSDSSCRTCQQDVDYSHCGTYDGAAYNWSQEGRSLAWPLVPGMMSTSPGQTDVYNSRLDGDVSCVPPQKCQEYESFFNYNTIIHQQPVLCAWVTSCPFPLLSSNQAEDRGAKSICECISLHFFPNTRPMLT